jgi:hypothetical protein
VIYCPIFAEAHSQQIMRCLNATSERGEHSQPTIKSATKRHALVLLEQL